MLPSTSSLIKKYDLAAKKALGQNFILDKNFTDKIAKTAGDLSSFEILEIGSGPGSLTRSILDLGARKLFAIEKDLRCIKILEELKSFYQERLIIINEDALNFDESKIFDKKFKIIANLPYNIGTILLFKWLKIVDKVESMTLMLQKEVAQRITTKPNSKEYGRLAVMVNFLCETKIEFDVSPAVFTPPPKVTSAVITIIPRPKPLFDVEFSKLERITAVLFNQRRKMIKSTLKAASKDPQALLESLNINPNLRPEDLAIEDFCRIAKVI